MLVFMDFYKMNTFFKYFESLPVGLNICITSLNIAIIVAEPGAQCALSMACVLQCGQHRAVASLVAMGHLHQCQQGPSLNPPRSKIKPPRMNCSCNNLYISQQPLFAALKKTWTIFLETYSS
jgi:hypothetical protein